MDRLILFVIFAEMSSQSTSIIPSFIKICCRDDPQLNNCLERSVEALRPFLREGISEFQIPPCEPLEIAQVKFDRVTGPAFVSSKYTNIVIKGGTNFIMKNITADMKKNYIELKISIPCLSIIADYNMDGKILMIPVTGSGKTNGNFSELDTSIKLYAIRYKSRKTNQTYLNFANCTVIINIGHGQIHLDNLLNGNKKIADGMNLFLNENFETMSAEWKPILEMKISENLKKFVNQIFSKYPLDLLFPLKNSQPIT